MRPATMGNRRVGNYPSFGPRRSVTTNSTFTDHRRSVIRDLRATDRHIGSPLAISVASTYVWRQKEPEPDDLSDEQLEQLYQDQLHELAVDDEDDQEGEEEPLDTDLIDE